MNDQAQLAAEDRAITGVPAGFPSAEEVELLGRIGLFSRDDERALRKLWRLLQDQTDDYLDRVLGMVAAYPALATALTVLRDENSEHWTDSPAILRHRFRRWLFETCFSPQQPTWIQELYSEFPPGLAMQALFSRLPDFRYLIALSFPLLATANTLLVGNQVASQDRERMQSALLKAILLQVTLVSKLYVKEGLW